MDVGSTRTGTPNSTVRRSSKAVKFYVDLIHKHGELGASSAGFQECANLFGQGQTAMWYDATSAVSVLEDPEEYPDLVGKIGYCQRR